jgi:hypothetical protein
LNKYCEQAGITKRITPHSLRHTFASAKAQSGVSPFQLKEWLGHARLDTTSIYVHMAKQNAKKVAECKESDGGDQLMRRMNRRWTSPPSTLPGPQAQLVNVALVPASELASLPRWQQHAMALPSGETLLVIPSNNAQLRTVGERIRQSLQERGRRSTMAIIQHS